MKLCLYGGSAASCSLLHAHWTPDKGVYWFIVGDGLQTVAWWIMWSVIQWWDSISRCCVFLTSPPDFPLYRVERRVLNPTLTVSGAINIRLLSLSYSLFLSFFLTLCLLKPPSPSAHADRQLISLDSEQSYMLKYVYSVSVDETKRLHLIIVTLCLSLYMVTPYILYLQKY